ncbi:MAG TPA: alpha-amylase family protein [Gaiellaceae bacterium]|jgi:maltose alpha-D-glucosyltransferase/alpha-amylase|nr:alpha-amylase family protein [Gaiellaceae bacterium]
MGPVDDRWYKDALIYELSVRTFADANGDGIGDFRGLTRRLDYLAGLGVTAVWLLPFQPSPWRDDGYDITNYYGVDPAFGDLGDFVRFVEHARDRGLRVLIDLVLNHTSNEHPWFQAARAGDRAFRDFYVWSKTKPPDATKGIVFPGVQKTTWSYDRAAKQYYFHRFYDFQPDLNIANPAVRDEMEKIIGFWVNLGISGFRVDAVPFLIEPISADDTSPAPEFEWLHEFRSYLSWRSGDAVLLGEANVERDQIDQYFGVGGLHMLFNFILNQQLWLALASEEASPIHDALNETASIPGSDQWATFLRNNDELDLGRLEDESRDLLFQQFAPSARMQLYGRGIRRRLAPMLDGDRRRIELAFALLLALPGTPVIFYGDEIGMGDDLRLDEREAVRTPMQWSSARNAGFSSAPRSQLVLPVISRGAYGYRRVNAADEQRDAGSLLHFVRRLVRARKESREFTVGSWEPLTVSNQSVFALRYRTDDSELVALHNLAGSTARIRSSTWKGLIDTFSNREYEQPGQTLELDGYGFRWLRPADAP